MQRLAGEILLHHLGHVAVQVRGEQELQQEQQQEQQQGGVAPHARARDETSSNVGAHALMKLTSALEISICFDGFAYCAAAHMRRPAW